VKTLKGFAKDVLFGPWVPQRAWERLRTLALRGMNIGGGSTVDDSGELWLLDHLAIALRARTPAVIFDVGANVGSYSKEIVDRFRGAVRLYSFEPAAAPFEKLRATVGMEPGVSLHRLALGDKAGNVTLFSDPGNTGLASLYRRDLRHIGVDMSREETVVQTTLDEFCSAEGVGSIDFLKLDCEGHELRVLHGASDLLRRHAIEAIQFEFGGCNLDSRTYFRDFYEILSPDYRMFRILRKGLAPIPEYHERLEVFTTTNFLALRPTHPLAESR
jgi:FkbM family methyltransferase